MDNNAVSKKFWIMIIGLCVLGIIIITVGFVVFSNKKPEVIEEEKDGGAVSLKYVSDASLLSIEKAVPTTDSVGMASNQEGSYFDFLVSTDVDDAKEITYELSIKIVSSNVSESDIVVYLEKEDSGTYNSVFKPQKIKLLSKKTKIGTEKGNMVLYKDTKKKKSTDNYRLRTWLSETSVTTEANYTLEINVEAVAN